MFPSIILPTYVAVVTGPSALLPCAVHMGILLSSGFYVASTLLGKLLTLLCILYVSILLIKFERSNLIATRTV
jgi:hypothetical protein